MQKKKVGILLIMDPDNTEDSSGACRSDNVKNRVGQSFKLPGTDETYLVFINNCAQDRLKSQTENDAQLDSTAHELGHVLSSIFRIPGGMQDDPRPRKEIDSANACCIRHGATAEQLKRIQTNELLAWKLAKKIRPQVSPDGIKAALDSYGV